MNTRKRVYFALSATALLVQVAFGASSSRINLAKRTNKDLPEAEVAAPFVDWPRDKVFLKVGDDIVLWGAIYDYIGLILKSKPLVLPAGTTWADVEKAKRFNEGKIAISMAKRYMSGVLLAQLARKANVDISKAKLTATGIVAKIVASFPEECQKEVMSGYVGPGSYISSCVTNTLLGDAYVESVIKPTVEVTDQEIADAKATRKAEIEKFTRLNADKKAKMNELLADIRSGKLKFEGAAEMLSQCVSSDRKGYWGKFGEDTSVLLPEIKAVVFSLPTNTLSEVVETPFSYHIFKVSSTPPEFIQNADDEEEAEDDTEDGEKTVHLSHIMFEKSAIPPVLDDKSAREFVFADKVAERVSDLKSAALTNFDIQCAFPLNLNKGKKRK